MEEESDAELESQKNKNDYLYFPKVFESSNVQTRFININQYANRLRNQFQPKNNKS